MAKFGNTYRIESSRWAYWDYGASGAYFITTCTHNRIHHFGKVENRMMRLSAQGEIVAACWAAIPVHFKDVELGAYQVMPNHFHGIIILTQDHLANGGNWNPDETPAQRRLGNAGSNTVSTMVGSFKSAVSRLVHQFDPAFRWQDRFHDNVIRTPADFKRIALYIHENPANWRDDRFFSE